MKAVLFIAATALLILVIETGRRSGFTIPIPFLLLYAAVVASGGACGKLAGAVSGALAFAYVVYAALVGFGPRTLTGGELQVLLGGLLYVGTGLLLGRVRDQRDGFLQNVLRHECELEEKIDERTRDLKENEAALKSSEEKFRQMAEMSPDGMLVHVDGEIVFANASLARILKVSSPEDLLGGQAMDLLAPEYRARIEHLRAKVMEGEVARLEQSEFLRSDGARIPVERSGSQISWEGNPAVLVLVRDVTEQKRVADDLRASHDQLHLITDNLPAWITYADAERRYRFVNKACSEWLAQPPDQIVGRTISEALGKPEQYEKIRPKIDRALAGEQLTFIEDFAYPDGITRTIQVSYIPHVGTTGGVEGYFSLIEDISELRRTEEALHQALKMEAIGQLTGGVAHDFNNLLAVILGNTELLQDEIGAHQLLTTIDRAASRGAELTQHLLAFSRRQALRPAVIDLLELVSGLETLLHRTLGEQVEIVTDAPQNLWSVVADAGQLESALLNLAINARDAMPEGGALDISCSNVELQEDDARVNDKIVAGEYVQIAVRDTGSGMSEDVLEHAFEPFYTTKDVGEGSGLGLSMVYGFAQQSAGGAAIDSTAEKGTEVSIFLPRAGAKVPPDES